MSDHTGQLDRYRLIRKLGSGGFGQVYLAKDRYHHNDVAIKVLPSLANEDLPRFLTEARIMMRLKHPHIVQILDFGIDLEEQTPFLVMEYAPHGTLRQGHPKGSCVPLPTILSYVTQLASALQVAHNDQVIHCDIKPENMLLNQQNQVLLSDFGIATMIPESVILSAQSLVGTIPYMAPEQAEGHPCPASDQYSFAVVVYEWLCGQRPFNGSFIQLAIQLKLNPPPSLCQQNPMISPEVEQIVFKALAKEPVERFDSVEAFALALGAVCSEHAPSTTQSPEASPEEVSPGNSKKLMSGKKDDHLPSISRDDAAISGVVAEIADLVKKGAQQPPVLMTPPPQTNPPVLNAISDITAPHTPVIPDPTVGAEPSIIELPPASRATRSMPTVKRPATRSELAVASTGPITRPVQQHPGLGATRIRKRIRWYAVLSKTSLKTLVGVVIGILLLFVGCLLVYYGPTANVTLGIATQDYSKQVTLTAKAGQQAQDVQAQQFSKDFTKSGTGTATGSQMVGTNPAQGTVIFTYNGSNFEGIVIPSDSIITTGGSNSIQFATTAEVLVWPSSRSKVPTPVSIQAVKPGKDGNVDEGTITVIPNNTLNSIAQAQNPPIAVSDLNLSVANDTATTGGGAKPTPAVTEQDLTNVKNNLHQQLQGEINAWQQQLSSIGAVDTPQITDTLINPPKVNDIEANGTFSATIKVTATVLLVRTADLQKEALKQLNDTIKNDKSYAGETILTDSNPAVTINQLKQISADANSITLTFNAMTKVGPRLITKEYVQQLIAGKPISGAKSILVNIYGVKTADITVSPSFMPWVTLWDGHINVTILPL